MANSIDVITEAYKAYQEDQSQTILIEMDCFGNLRWRINKAPHYNSWSGVYIFISAKTSLENVIFDTATKRAFILKEIAADKERLTNIDDDLITGDMLFDHFE